MSTCKKLLGSAVALATLATAAACGSDSSSSSGSSGPIKIGSISGITGGAVFPEASKAAKAVFNEVNAEGGIDGRKIEYLVEDDKGDPAVAAQAARKLVDSDERYLLENMKRGMFDNAQQAHDMYFKDVSTNTVRRALSRARARSHMGRKKAGM